MSLAGITLETKEGTQVPAAEALRGKIVVLFFSSEWCPACKLFVPTLHTLHEVARENEVPFEVVYVSSDRDAEQKARYMAKSHGDWLSVPFEDTATRDALKAKYGCFAGAEAAGFPGVARRAGIPSLVVVGEGGEEHVHMDCDPATEIDRKGDAILDEWAQFAWPAA